MTRSTIRILHLSDLHFGTEKQAEVWAGQLVEDLTGELGCQALDGLVISGDVANRATAEEYGAAKSFLEKVRAAVGPEPEGLVVVPGNHDIDREISRRAHRATHRDDCSPEEQASGRPIGDGEYLEVRDEARYRKRFAPFADFHLEATGRPYPLDPDDQLTITRFQGPRILVLGLSSVHLLDHREHTKAAISSVAVTRALKQVRDGSLGDEWLKIAVWHHPLHSAFEDRITDHGFLDRLAKAGFRLALHGHVHRAENHLFRYDRNPEGRRIEVVCAGTFGAPQRQWIPGYPLQYNLLCFFEDRLVVETRKREKPNGAWSPDARWLDGTRDPKPRYEIAVPRPQGAPFSPPNPLPDPGTEGADERSALADQLRRLIERRADRLAEVFRHHGGPAALSQVYVEVGLTPRSMGAAAGACTDEPRGRKAGRDAWIEKAELDVLSRRTLRIREVIDQTHDRWVLLGEPGSGKSTLLQHLALELLAEGLRLPLLLSVGELCAKWPQDLREIVDTVYGHGAGDAVVEAIAHGRAVLLVDGLDEAKDPGLGRDAVCWIAEQSRGCQLVVSSRLVGYELPSSEFRELSILPLGQQEQRELLSNWIQEPDRVDRTIETMSRRPRLRRMAENPLLLTLVGMVLRADPKNEVPRRRGQLYRMALDLLLRKGFHPRPRLDDRRNEDASRRLREPATAALALGRIALKLHGEIGDLYPEGRIVEELSRDDRLSGSLRSIYGGLDGFLVEVAETTGVLVPETGDPLSPGLYRFPHRTFREYLAATSLERDIGVHGIGAVPPEALAGAIRGDRARSVHDAPGELGRLLLDARSRPALWSEVLALTCGLLGPGGGDALVRRVAAEGCAELVARVVAEAEGIAPDTVLAALGVERGRESWESRRELLEELPSIVGDLLVTVRLIWKFLQTTTCGIDLWFARETLRRIARGEVTSEALESSPEMVRAEAAEYAERLLEHLDDEKRRQAKTLVEDQRRPIPDGAFLAGSPEGEDGRYDDEGPQHPVTIESGFPIMAVPVTNEMFELFDPDHREHRAFREQVSDEELRGHPVVNVTWWEAMLFAEWVGCRLPLEAEWEYACRAKTTTRYWRGDGEQHLAEVGWYGKNSGGRTHAVAEKPANPWGLHDVHGNVWEWCLDVWEGSYQSRRDGVIIRPDSPAFDPASDAWRVVRGGGWFDVPGSARSACRYDGGPRNGWLGQGFRLVLLPLPPARGS